jgi:DNA-binding transcriptional ArsR family regulator
MEHGQLLHISEAEGERLRAARPDDDRAELLAGAYHALGDPTRLTLALALRGDGELCVCDLSWIVQRSQNLVSHHMKVLKARGLVRSRKQGKMTMYALTDRGQALLDPAR